MNTAVHKKTATLSPGRSSTRRGQVAVRTSANHTSRAAVKENIARYVQSLLRKAPKASFPGIIKPMLATRVTEPLDGEDWVYEIKWDGYRTLAYLNKGKVDLYSRNQLSFNTKFSPVAAALKQIKENMILDGEIIAVNEDDKPDFQLLQNHMGADVRFVFYVFDIIWYDGRDLSGLTLLERKSILSLVVPANQSIIRYSSHIEETGKQFFEVAVKHGLEGIMAKKAGSVYTKGFRSNEWLKIKNEQRLEAIICGFTEPRNSRSYFGAVILGKYIGNQLVYIGHSGSGFNEKLLKEMYAKFKPLIRSTCPFEKTPKTNMPVTWLKPELVCEVKFTEWTTEKILRHPIFLGLREDKKASNEKNEKVVKAPVLKKKTASAASKAMRTPDISRSKKTAAGSKEEQVTVKGNTLKLTNLDKLYWPVEKITKRDVINYYSAIAPYIMPYMKNRPQSMNRHPDGITKQNFFQKNVGPHAPEWIETFPFTSDADNEPTNYLVCTNEADLLYMASQGCIEMNPWHSRVKKPDNPDWCVIDLDPDTNTFNKVIETANMVKQVLDSIGATGYCKTSGSTGLHIYIPLGAKYSYEQSRLLAQLVVQFVHHQLPSFTSLERSPAKRKGMIYLDYLQNKATQTIAAPYSLRPKPGAPVSTPLHWDEVTRGLKIKDHNIHNILARLEKTGDIFQPVLGAGINMKAALQKAGAL
ncbi:MAG: ligase [Sediminibacterium sp.]|nr:ligase [Sediminibacterium sp.]